MGGCGNQVLFNAQKLQPLLWNLGALLFFSLSHIRTEILKSDNLYYNMLVLWVAGTNDSLTKLSENLKIWVKISIKSLEILRIPKITKIFQNFPKIFFRSPVKRTINFCNFFSLNLNVSKFYFTNGFYKIKSFSSKIEWKFENLKNFNKILRIIFSFEKLLIFLLEIWKYCHIKTQ